MVPQARSFETLLIIAFFLGLAGSSFAVGVSYVSRWYPPEQQGTALGVYGLGNMGQSAAVFLGPLLGKLIGIPAVYQVTAALVLVWGIAFGLLARDAPAKAAPKGLGATLAILTNERVAWVLSAFYFLTFGGFVAFSIYLPTLLRDQFGLSTADAGFRTAGFVVLATLLRPVGGWLSDKIGGARVLSAVFLGIVPFALLLSWSEMLPFTVGALGCAALMGLGNGGVFKLVPQYFPASTGTVTGLVGAMGGMGGFFPPLLLGFFRDRIGAVWPGFLCYSRDGSRAVVAEPQDLHSAPGSPRAGLAARIEPHRRPTAGRLLGHLVDRVSDSLHRGRIANAAELRRSSGDLHVCRDLCPLRCGLSLLRVVAKAADANVLAARLADLFSSRCFLELGPVGAGSNHASCCAALHQQAVPAALVDASVACSGDVCWLWPSLFLWSSAGFTSSLSPDDQLTYVDLRFRISSRLLSIAHGRLPGCCFTAWISAAVMVLAGIALSLLAADER